MSEGTDPNQNPDAHDSTPAGGRQPLKGTGFSAPPPPAGGYMASPMPQPQSQRGKWVVRILIYVLASGLIFSIAMNVYTIQLLATYNSVPYPLPYKSGDTSHRIVILPMKGVVDAEMEQFVTAAARVLREMSNKPKAIVLRVDSPGGSAFASDRIWHVIDKLKEELDVPVVASYGGLAASGGYYVSVGADHIVAEPTCITGSVGVISINFNPEGLFTEILKVKPNVETATKSDKKDLGNNPFRWNEEDQAHHQKLLDHLHAQFMDRVRKGRGKKMTDEQYEEVFAGEALILADALKLNVVDEEGYLDDAIAKAAELAQIDKSIKPHVDVIVAPKPLMYSLIGAGYDQKPPSVDAELLREMMVDAVTRRFEYRYYP